MRRKKSNLENVLRKAMKNSGLSTHELSDISGVTQPVICRFINGTRSINIKSVSKLAEALDLELKPKSRRKGR